MKINKIIEYACIMLDKKDLLDSPILSGQTDEDVSRVEQLNQLLRCVNYTLIKLVSHYKSLTASIRVDSSRPIQLSKLAGRVIQNIVSVKNNDGVNISYSIEENTLILPNVGQVVVKYAYYPEEVTFGEEINLYLENVHEQIIALSVVSDYYFYQGLEDEMERYDIEFQNAMRSIIRKKADIYIRPRRWI